MLKISNYLKYFTYELQFAFTKRKTAPVVHILFTVSNFKHSPTKTPSDDKDKNEVTQVYFFIWIVVYIRSTSGVENSN